VIDVGYSGVIGADRIVPGQSPYGHMPREGSLKACGARMRRARFGSGSRRTAAASLRTSAATRTGRSPTSLTSPGTSLRLERALGQAARGARDGARLRPAGAPRPRAARTPLRRGGSRDAPVRVGRVPVHAVRVELEHERRDHARVPDLRLLARHVRVRARRVPRPGGWRSSARSARAVCGAHIRSAPVLRKGRICSRFCGRDRCCVFDLLLEPSPAHAARVFWDRTFGWQVGRDSPFSIWGWGQYHAAGIPDLGPFQQLAIALLLAGAIACYFVPGARPRSSSPRSPPRC
jgi:hypothetical protein